MDNRVKEIIDSGIIEEYLFGTLSADEQTEVEALIEQHPALKDHMQAVQEVLWGMADDMAIEPPPSVKKKIMEEIRSENPTAATGTSGSKHLGWWVAAAVALIALPTLIYTNGQNQKRLYAVKADLLACQADQSAVEGELLAVQQLIGEKSTITILRNTDVSLEVIAYARPDSKQLYLDTRSLPVVPTGKCLQLWGDLDGSMIKIAVLDPDQDYLADPLVYNPSYTSINLTVEDLGDDGLGSDHATVSSLVASAVL
jgi:hypothetical protein